MTYLPDNKTTWVSPGGDALTVGKAYRCWQVNRYMDDVLSGGVVFDSHIYDSDHQSRTALNEYVSAVTNGVPLPDGFAWRDAANVEHAMNPAELLDFSAAMLTFVYNCHSNCWTHKNAINALATVGEVESYDFTTGWPT